MTEGIAEAIALLTVAIQWTCALMGGGNGNAETHRREIPVSILDRRVRPRWYPEGCVW